jgi:hypothetical protein
MTYFNGRFVTTDFYITDELDAVREKPSGIGAPPPGMNLFTNCFWLMTGK